MQLQELGSGDDCHDRVEWPLFMDHYKVSLPSSFIPLLSCNALPSSADVEQVNEFKGPALDKLSEFDVEESGVMQKIRELEVELRRIRNARAPFEKQVHACEVIVSPIRRLPNDIIHEIVKHCAIYSAEDLKTHFPSQLAQVCRSWRKVVLGTSSLWKDVQLLWPGTVDPMTRFNQFARLSRSLPLSIRLDERIIKLSELARDKGALPVLKALMLDENTRQRLQSLELLSSRQDQLLHALKDSKLPSLKCCLALQAAELVDEENGGAEYQDAVLSINELLANTPQLEHLWFGAAHSDLGPLLEMPPEKMGPWSQLTTLHFSGSIYVDEWVTLLTTCTNLERAWIRLTAPADVDFDVPDLSIPHTHHHLNKLIIQFGGYVDHILLPFAGFRFPKLDALQIGFVRTMLRVEPHPELQPENFVDVFPSLHSVVLMGTSGIELGFEGIYHLLLSVPSTKSLLMNFSAKYFMETLAFLREPQADGRRPLPLLQELELEFLPVSSDKWGKPVQEQLTAGLFDLCEARTTIPPPSASAESSSPPTSTKLQEMVVRFNPTSQDRETGITWESRARCNAYFDILGDLVANKGMDDVLTVLIHTEGFRQFASPVMKDFMYIFDFWRLTM